ncbi:MAG: oligosaccharide flippase family protein, partial [Oligoflexales bacterium]|nr:oligosaccharide flippase family protein [Oligoflexales bacterium]
MQEASLKKRYFAKLATNLASALFAMVTMLIITRALGARDFGRFEFVTANFLLILNTLTVNVPVAYFNFISERNKKQAGNIATGVTFLFSVGVCFFVGLAIVSGDFIGFNAKWWPDIPSYVIWLGFIVSILMFFLQLFSYLADGQALTLILELAKSMNFFIRGIIVVALFSLGMLSIDSYFAAYIIVLSLILIFILISLRRREGISLESFNFKNKSQEIRCFASYTAKYVKPLIFLMAVSFVYSYVDRWFLQLSAGSAEQGYYSIAERLSAFAFMFTSAMSPVLMREYAISFKENDFARLRSLFDRIKLFLFLASGLCFFLATNSDLIVRLLGKSEFSGAYWPIFIMCLFPIHQTFGQLSNPLLMVSGRTKEYSYIGIIAGVIGLPITYFLLADRSALIPGLSMGAMGLAIKVVVHQFIGSNLYLFYNTRLLGTSYFEWLKYQVWLLFVPFAMAILVKYLSGMVPLDGLMIGDFIIPYNIQNSILRLTLSG